MGKKIYIQTKAYATKAKRIKKVCSKLLAEI